MVQRMDDWDVEGRKRRKEEKREREGKKFGYSGGWGVGLEKWGTCDLTLKCFAKGRFFQGKEKGKSKKKKKEKVRREIEL